MELFKRYLNKLNIEIIKDKIFKNTEQNLESLKNKPKNIWGYLKPIETSKVKKVDFPKEHYVQGIHDKYQIVLHHTVSGPGIQGDIATWLGTTSRIATAIIIDHDGIANQCFSSKYWAHHLGVPTSFLRERGFDDSTTRNIKLNRESIAIEIDNWGGLILGDGKTKQFGDRFVKTKLGKYYAAYGNIVDVPVVEYPEGYRGYKYYEEYSDEQIKTLGELLLYWNNHYKIPLKYNKGMWDISDDALSGKPGIWSHTSYRLDKSDIHPQPNLIEMLKSLKDLT